MNYRRSDVQGGKSAASLALAVVLLLSFVSDLRAQAPGAPRRFDIPPQPLVSALLAFSEQADLQILVASRLIDNRRSPGVAGVLSPPDALAALLQAQPLTFRYVTADTVAISGSDDAAVRQGEKGESQAINSDPH